MTRLTKKDKYGHFYTNQANCRNIWSLDDKKLEGEYFENKTLAIDGKAIDKLGKLEDIEEWFGKKKFYGTALNEPNKILELEFEKLDFRPEEDLLLIHFKVLNTLAIHIFYNIFEYGKTWALTKEELENDK